MMHTDEGTPEKFQSLNMAASETNRASLVAQSKEFTCNAGNLGDAGLIPGWKDPLEEEIATHSSILAGNVPWTVERGGP